MKITFIDKNKSLVAKVKKAVKYFPVNIDVLEGDIFKQKGIIVSASNPDYTFGGGLDAQILKRFPEACELARKHKGKNYAYGDIIFTITVNEEIKASRELVASALKFALDEKNHINPDANILITGLGTAIGGLDEDDFVWLFLQTISEVYGYGWGIKFTQKNGTDFRTGKVLYKVGKELKELGAKKSNESCDIGFHLGKDFIGAGNYNMPEKILFCVYDKENLCHEHTDKVRVSKLLVVSELPQWLGYGLNGKKIVNKIGKKFNPEKYNPYQATKLPKINDIKKTELPKMGDKVWNQVWNQVYATSYWAISIHFEIGISHWFGQFLSLGVMPIFINGKVKFFGKKGKYLGEYSKEELFN